MTAANLKEGARVLLLRVESAPGTDRPGGDLRGTERTRGEPADAAASIHPSGGISLRPGTDDEHGFRHMELRSDPHLFPLVTEPASRWERAGLSAAQERRFNLLAAGLVALFLAGWIYSIAFVNPELRERRAAALSSRLTASPLSAEGPSPSFLLDALRRELEGEVAPLHGESGRVYVVLGDPGEAPGLPALPDSLAGRATLELQPIEGTPGAPVPVDAHASPAPGVWNVALRMGATALPMPDLRVITPVALSERRGGRIGRYLVGAWPFERGGAPSSAYDTPKGLVEVTPENRDVRVSEHVALGELLTKGQEDVWPKYTVISPRALDKVELTLQELERRGHRADRIFVISGFRTPNYNESGGDVSGRGQLSRHMYGDAIDFAIDNDGDGRMDDLNGDGRVNVRDARIVAEAAQEVERAYPRLVGGIGIYAPTGAHAGFVHIDTRGKRARWGAW